MSSPEVIVIGAGLAGLTCARRLQEAGRDCLVLEAADAVGGRVRTERVDGFLLDRGFQVFLTAYPEARRWLDYPALQLRPFTPGALVRLESGMHRVSDPFRAPGHLWATLRAPVGSWLDKLRIATFRHRARRGSLESVFQRPETSALEAFRAHGFSETILERFLRPWLGGIFLEPDLVTSSRMLDFVFRMFAEGAATVPARGMQAIPEQLAAGLPAVRLRSQVVSLEPGRVRLADGEVLEARRIVVATEGSTAARLLPELGATRWRSTTTVYFAAAKSPVGEGTLILNGTGRGCVNHAVVMSDVAPEYAPPGQALLAVSVHGLPEDEDAVLARRVQTELEGWWGAQVAAWRWLKSVRVPEALPVNSPLVQRPAEPVRQGVWVCGDYRDTASIQGAMASGRRTADALVVG
jgi:phytoene dehydrogenase-like protein